MNDLVPGARVEGTVNYHGQNIYARGVDPIAVRTHVGMVFQKPNPFPKSIYDNIAYGPRVTGMKVDDMDDLVEGALRGAALWDEVKDKLKQSAYGLSGGQQQRLCIARTIATKPDVILMDEPCSALDPIATARIEDLMLQLTEDYTIIIVTHNMQQAARVSDRTAFFTARPDETTGNRTGLLVEYNLTKQLFSHAIGPANRGLHLRPLRLSPLVQLSARNTEMTMREDAKVFPRHQRALESLDRWTQASGAPLLVIDPIGDGESLRVGMASRGVNVTWVRSALDGLVEFGRTNPRLSSFLPS